MIIIDDTYKKIIDPKIRGRKPKYRLEKIEDGVLKKYIFKYGAINYEIYAELIAEELGKQLGIEMAHYEVAYDGNNYGVITDNFLSEGEFICSIDYIKQNIENISRDSGLSVNLKDNTIENTARSASDYDSRLKYEDLLKELIKRWLFYTIILESDKNATNIAFVKGPKGVRISPDYDNSNMALLNNDVTTYVDDLRRGASIYNITDGVKNEFYAQQDTNNYSFMDNFSYLVETYPNIVTEIMPVIEELNINYAMDVVEQRNEFEIPWTVKYWIETAIKTRIQDIVGIYKNKKNKEKIIK